MLLGFLAWTQHFCRIKVRTYPKSLIHKYRPVPKGFANFWAPLCVSTPSSRAPYVTFLMFRMKESDGPRQRKGWIQELKEKNNDYLHPSSALKSSCFHWRFAPAVVNIAHVSESECLSQMRGSQCPDQVRWIYPQGKPCARSKQTSFKKKKSHSERAA